MQHFKDQMGRSVAMKNFPPRRIVSLVPSQTELLFDLGLEKEVVGITKFCVHPETWYREKNRVGGTKTVSLAKLAALSPDLVIGNKEENDREQIGTIAAQFPVWMSDVFNLSDALEMIRQVGAISGKSDRAEALAGKIKAAFEQQRSARTPARPRVAYFIWRKPYMVVGRDTFIDFMLAEAGFENVFRGLSRYPEITLDMLREANPEVVFLSSEPFPFAAKHFDAFRAACPAAQIKIVNGELFSWYGSRLLLAPQYFQQLRKSL